MKSRSIKLPAITVVVLALTAGGFVWDRRLRAEAHERESSFIAIHFLAVNVMAEGMETRDVEDLLQPYGGEPSPLAKPFRDGLVYQPADGAFTLEESRARRISLFRRDRLIATDRNWPRWESSGKLARKYPGQLVPPAGFR